MIVPLLLFAFITLLILCSFALSYLVDRKDQRL